MIDIKTGTLVIDDEFVITSDYSFDDFKKTTYYNGQDSTRIINLKGRHTINNIKYAVSLFFRAEKLYMISLIYCDDDFSEKDESSRRLVHDKILDSLGIKVRAGFEWGKISSEYDAKSNLSSIDIVYY